jgi:hypothetical protein
MKTKMYLKVKDEPSLVRDSKSNAVLNVNNDALNKYKKEKEQALKMKNVIEEHSEIKKQLEKTQQDISDIKLMLMQLMEKR